MLKIHNELKKVYKRVYKAQKRGRYTRHQLRADVKKVNANIKLDAECFREAKQRYMEELVITHSSGEKTLKRFEKMAAEMEKKREYIKTTRGDPVHEERKLAELQKKFIREVNRANVVRWYTEAEKVDSRHEKNKLSQADVRRYEKLMGKLQATLTTLVEKKSDGTVKVHKTMEAMFEYLGREWMPEAIEGAEADQKVRDEVKGWYERASHIMRCASRRSPFLFLLFIWRSLQCLYDTTAEPYDFSRFKRVWIMILIARISWPGVTKAYCLSSSFIWKIPTCFSNKNVTLSEKSQRVFQMNFSQNEASGVKSQRVLLTISPKMKPVMSKVNVFY